MQALHITTVHSINDSWLLWRGLLVQIAKLKQQLRLAKSKAPMLLIYIDRVLTQKSAGLRLELPNRLITSSTRCKKHSRACCSTY